MKHPNGTIKAARLVAHVGLLTFTHSKLLVLAVIGAKKKKRWKKNLTWRSRGEKQPLPVAELGFSHTNKT